MPLAYFDWLRAQHSKHRFGNHPEIALEVRPLSNLLTLSMRSHHVLLMRMIKNSHMGHIYTRSMGQLTLQLVNYKSGPRTVWAILYVAVFQGKWSLPL